MREVFVIEIGCGSDLHGQDVTKAAVKACEDAINFNSLPGLRKVLPNGDVNNMHVRVTLGVPDAYCDRVDLDRVRKVFPYGTVEVAIKTGGLMCQAGIVLPEHGDAEGDDTILIVNAAVEVCS